MWFVASRAFLARECADGAPVHLRQWMRPGCALDAIECGMKADDRRCCDVAIRQETSCIMQNRYHETLAWAIAPVGTFLGLLAMWTLAGTTLQNVLPGSVRENTVVLLCSILVALTAVEGALVFIQRALDAPRASLLRRAAKPLLQIMAGLLAAGMGALGGQLAIEARASTRAFAEPNMPWPVLAFLIALLVYVSVIAFLTYQISSLHFRCWDNRAAMLSKLEKRYSSYLSNPLLRTTRAELVLRATPSTLAHLHSMVPDGRGEPGWLTLKPEAALRSLYDPKGEGALRGQLLIVGGPGAGKSTQLYLLGLALANEAQVQPTAGLPIILDLATWDLDADSLEDWLCKAVGEAYHVHNRIVSRWITKGQIVPLLDGLDDIRDCRKRACCVGAIMAYAAQHPNAPLIACSRPVEGGTAADAALHLSQVIHLQPLAPDAIDQTLSRSGEGPRAVASAASRNAMLGEVLRTPLMVSLVLATYADQTTVPDYLLHAQDPSVLRDALFRDYVARLLSTGTTGVEKEELEKASPGQRGGEIDEALIWLGYQLRQHSVQTFYLDELQRDWLPEARGEKVYSRSVVGMTVMIQLIVGLSLGLFAALCITWVYGIDNGAVIALLFGRSSNAVSGFVVRVIVGLIGGIGLGLGVASALNAASQIVLAHRDTDISNGMQSARVLGTAAGLVGALAAGTAAGVGMGLLSAVAVGTVVGIVVGTVADWSGRAVSPDDVHSPSQGVYRSARSAVESVLVYTLLGLAVGGLVGGLATWLVVDLANGRSDLAQHMGQMGALAGAVVGAVCVGLYVGVDAGLDHGGAAVLQHLALRWVLCRSGVLPLRFVRCLDEATALGLLCRAGSGYRFPTTMLRDYFADVWADHVQGQSPDSVPRHDDTLPPNNAASS